MIPEPVGDEAIYLFLDELAADGAITLNGVVKPYSRLVIRKKLEEAQAWLADRAVEQKEGITSGRPDTGTTDRSDRSLSGRQVKELAFWLSIYSDGEPDAKMKILLNPAVIYYRDSLFSVTVSPLFGFNGGHSRGREARSGGTGGTPGGTGPGGTPGAIPGSLAPGESLNTWSWKNGAKVYGNYRNWAFFAALQDNHQKPLLGRPEYLTPERGGHLKGGTDFSEMTGGISYSWRWGNIAFLKESPVWGSGYAGTNILSGRAPSFMHLRLWMKPVRWGEMTWIHGWLTSMVVDSTRSYWVSNAYGTEYREHYRPKYFAANIFTFTPVQRLHISAGNSVVWSDPRITPYYLMPLFFYKSVDHGVNSGISNSNAQMFLDISSHNIRHLHLYGTLFIDELSTKRFTTSDYNFFSWKGGMRTGNYGFLPNIWVTAEFTFTYPLTFQHNVPVTTFENQGFNMGHWLRDNSRSWYLALEWRPLRASGVKVWHERSERGPDYQSIGGSRVGLPYLGTIDWSNRATGIEFSYMITGGVQAALSVTMRNVSGEGWWYPAHLYGRTTTLGAGMVWGF